MSPLTDYIAMLDFIDRIEGVVSSFIHADWRGAARKGPLGIAAEAGRSLVGANRFAIHIPRDADWSGAEVEAYLRHYGIKIWGRGFTETTVCFYVKERQANWAEYLLLRRGIPVEHTLRNSKNARYGAAHAPGDSPPAWNGPLPPGLAPPPDTGDPPFKVDDRWE